MNLDAFIFYAFFNTTGVTVGDVNSFDNAQNNPSSNSTLLSIMQNTGNSVTALNATAIQFHLDSAFAPFIQNIEAAPFNFVDPYTVEQHGGVVAGSPNAWMAANGTTVGDGPYITKVLVPNSYATLIANPHYWAQNLTNTNLVLEPAKIPLVTINYKTDELTRSLDVTNNVAQASIITFNDLSHVLSSCSQCYIPNTGLSGTMEFVAIDTLKAPLNNSLVRQAIVHAINLTQIESAVYDGYSSPVVGPTPRGFFYYNSSLVPPSFNVTLAKQLLASAGYPNGNGLPAINYIYPQSAYLSLVGQLMTQDLAAIGITLKPQELGFSTWVSMISINGHNATAPDMEFLSWTAGPDFSQYEYLVDAQLGVYFTLNNQTIHNLIEQTNTQFNNTLRAQEISQVAFDVQQQAAYIWLGQDNSSYDTGGGYGNIVWNHCLTGMWYDSALNGVDFNSVYYTCNPT